MLGQQVFRVGIVDVLGIANIVDIVDVADIGVDIGTDIADIADRMLRILRWEQVDAYKVSQGCPITLYKGLLDRSRIYYKEVATLKIL